jgi:RNA polymerase sigma factor (sigma-70 family)
VGGTDQLAERALTGDPAAYEQLYAQVAERLLMYIQLRLGPRLREHLEPVDILQDAYLEAHRSFTRFEARGPAAFVKWMFRIVDHRIRDQADRASTRKRTAPALEDAGAFEQVRGALPGPATRAGNLEERAALVEAIQSLGDEPRALLLDHYFHGQTAADIAAATGQTDRHVRRLLRAAETELGRALQRLRNLGADAPDAAELGARSLDAEVRAGFDRPASPARVGRYVVQGELGRGAIGVVLRAVDERTGAQVAVKLLSTDEPSARRRFEREARALLKLSHPNIVDIVDAGDHEGAPYLVTALVEGPSLHTRLAERGPLELGAAVELARQLALALEHAHGLGVLHRDVKPQNVLLPRESLAVLTDFSLAKLVDPGQSQLSVHGQQLGTEGFWPPEQARGDLGAIGPASDVYGLGATLYAMLTGEPPLRGATVSERIRATLQDAPAPPSSLRPGVPAALDELCLRCLEKAPARRFQTAGELARALAGAGVAP